MAGTKVKSTPLARNSTAIAKRKEPEDVADVILRFIHKGQVDSALDFAWLCYKTLPMGSAKMLAAELYPDQSIESAKVTLSRRFIQQALRVDEAIKIIKHTGQMAAFVDYLSKEIN